MEFTDPADGWPVGRSRLDKMTYPNPPGYGDSSARRVTMAYGTPLLPDDLLSRLAETKTSIGTGAASQVAAFGYIGSGRRARMATAGGLIAQDLGLDEDPSGSVGPAPAGTIGLMGLDRLGRVADLHWRQAGGGTTSLTRLKYTYDVEGNRLTATRTPRPTPGTTPGTESQVNAYDLLSRLTDCDINHHDGGATLVRDDHWDLDLLGNWNERAMNSDIAPDAIDEHAVDNRNIIEALTRTVGGSPVTTAVRYDAAGNLQFDGEYAYQYDAWGRLLQINEATVGAGSPPPLVLGNLIKHFAYDGLGRMIRVQSPYPAPGYAGGVRSERLFYDGIRRIQEVWVDPVDDTEDAAMAGDPAALEALAFNPELDGDVATLGTENSQAASSGGSGLPPGVTLEREYIWGPGDNGVDELLVQYDRNRAPWWVLQDAGLDTIALCDLGGPPAGGAPNSARIVWQATYDAYGSVLTAENPGSVAYAYLRAGHKGLFFDRLDVGVVDPYGAERPRLEPGAEMIGQIRNRAYLPQLGRFAQPDPNATGIGTIGAAMHSGGAMSGGVDVFDLERRYGDGNNVYEFLRSSPSTGSDPLGLFEFSIMGLLGASTTAQEVQTDYDQSIVDHGMSAFGSVKAMFGDYAIDQMMDAEWASDWSASDYDYSKSIRQARSVRRAERENGPILARRFAWNRLMDHHIITTYREHGRRFKSLLRQYKLHLADVNRIVGVQWKYHKGPGHSKKYHDLVFNTMVRELNVMRHKVGGELSKSDAAEAVKKALDWIEDYLKRDPGILRRY